MAALRCQYIYLKILMFQSLRRDSSSGRAIARGALVQVGDCFNLSGEIPQVAARLLSQDYRAVDLVSISQARFLKWPLCLQRAQQRSRKCFNLSGEIPQVAATLIVSPRRSLCRFQSLRRDSSSGRLDKFVKQWYTCMFQSLRRDSSSGRLKLAIFILDKAIVSISQARFLKWPPPGPVRPG